MVKEITRRIRWYEREYIPVFRHTTTYRIIWFTLFGLPLLALLGVEMLFDYIMQQIEVKQGKTTEIKLRNIMEGWANLAFPNAKVEALARKRAAICAQCPAAMLSTTTYDIVVDNRTKSIRGMSCQDCGCPLSAKVRAVNDSCPRQKW